MLKVREMRLLRNDKVQSRVAELQGSTAELITDLRDAARRHTKAAIDLYVTAMNDETLGTRVRLVAAKELLDRGHGKAPQTITVEPSAYDSLELDDQQSLLAAIRHIKLIRLGAVEDGDGPAPAHH